MKQAPKIASVALGALLATGTVSKLEANEPGRQLAEPFKDFVSNLLSESKGDLVRVDRPTDLAESYKSGSSIVVEGNVGISDSMLMALQDEINEKYSHLNILVYIAEDGKSFADYKGETLDRNNLCDSSPGLKHLRDSFYKGVDKAGEGNHVIFYLAAKEPGYENNMVCAFISQEMGKLVGYDEDIFVKGRPLFDSVFDQLKPDFNKVGAIKAFLNGLDERVNQGKAEIERNKQAHLAKITSLKNTLDVHRTSVENGLNKGEWDLNISNRYASFDGLIQGIGAQLSGDPQYITGAIIGNAENDILSLNRQAEVIIQAVTLLESNKKKIISSQKYVSNMLEHENYEELRNELGELSQAVEKVSSMIDNKNLDYIDSVGGIDKAHQKIADKLAQIERAETVALAGKSGASIALLSFMGFLNRRKGRTIPKKEFEAELEKLQAGFEETRSIFENEIEGNTESIEMFFGDQKGETANIIEELKRSVAYISVILPKISEILQESSPSIGSVSALRATPYEEAIKFLTEDEHIIDPSESDADRSLLEKISNSKIQDFSELVDNMTKTLPELIELLDSNITSTKNIFSKLNTASEEIDVEKDKYEHLIELVPASFNTISKKLGEKFEGLVNHKDSTINSITEYVQVDNSNDILSEYHSYKSANEYIEFITNSFDDISTYIDTYKPSQYRKYLETKGYDTDPYFQEILLHYTSFFEGIQGGVKNVGVKSDVSEKEISGIINSIYHFYGDMERKANYHKESERLTESQSAQFDEIGTSKEEISNHLGERVDEDTLLKEGEHNVYTNHDQMTSQLRKVFDAVQVGDYDIVNNHINGIETSLETTSNIINDSKNIALTHDEELEKLNEIKNSIYQNIEAAESKISHLKKLFSDDIMILRIDDFEGTESDRNIANNIEEINEYFAGADSILEELKQALFDGKLLECGNKLEEIYKIYKRAGEKIHEINSVYQNVEKVESENPTTFGNLATRIDALNIQEGKYNLIPGRSDQLDVLVAKMNIIEGQLDADNRNPYILEDDLDSLEENLTKMEHAFLSDNNEYHECVKDNNSLEKIYKRYQQKLQSAASDNLVDSKKVRQAMSNRQMAEIDTIKILIENNIKLYSYDWYKLSDTIDSLVSYCEDIIDIIEDDNNERKEAKRFISSAKSNVSSARNWSGTHVTIGSNIGQQSLREANELFNDGRFEEAMEYASKASDQSKNAIRKAESEDDDEKRRRKRAKKRREAARRASYSSSSSSSSSFSSSSSSSSSSGFSGGGGF